MLYFFCKEGYIMDINLDLIKSYFKKRDIKSNKGDYGKVGLLGGSLNYCGALKLCYLACGALRSGVGLVRIIIKKDFVSYVLPNVLEETVFVFDDNLDAAIDDLDALAVGMGWTVNEENAQILKKLLETYSKTLIIDADGLNILANNLDWLSTSNAKIILTPHLKEFSRLCNINLNKIMVHKEYYAKEFAKKYNVILLLKGHISIITDGNDIYYVKKGGAGMATAGSGDVLSGILVGFMGYNEYNLLSVAACSYLNGLAGELAEAKNTDIGMIASDTIACISTAIKMIRGEKELLESDN